MTNLNLLSEIMSYSMVVDITIFSDLKSTQSPTRPTEIIQYHISVYLADGITLAAYDIDFDATIDKVYNKFLDHINSERN